jgi:hypothetical protein
MKKVNVVCFYWEGDRWKSDFSGEMPKDESYRAILHKTGEVSLELASQYVNNLYHGMKRNSTVPFDFICFTNEELTLDEGVERRNFPFLTTAGVLPRLYMFSPESGLFGRQTLCLDLDVIICGDMDPLLSYDGLFCARSKFKPREHWKLDGDVMSFRAGEEVAKIFWEPFIKDVDAAVEMVKGRERYWVRHVANDLAERWENVAPGTVVSYKWHGLRFPELARKASVISCHGYPRPHQVKIPWIKKHWEAA